MGSVQTIRCSIWALPFGKIRFSQLNTASAGIECSAAPANCPLPIIGKSTTPTCLLPRPPRRSRRILICKIRIPKPCGAYCGYRALQFQPICLPCKGRWRCRQALTEGLIHTLKTKSHRSSVAFCFAIRRNLRFPVLPLVSVFPGLPLAWLCGI